MRSREDIRSLTGPEKAAILVLSLGEDHTAKIFSMMDDEEIKEISQTMANLGTINSSVVERLFVDFADTFHLPIVHLVDQPGFVVGVDAEKAGTIRRGVRALAAVYQAQVPFVSVIVRRVFGVAGAGHGNAQKLNLRFAWPSGDWGSLPIEGGLEAAYRRELEASPDPARLKEEITGRLEAVRSPFRTAEGFGVEKLIDPRDTRPLLTEWVADAYRLVATDLGPSRRPARP